MDYKYNIIKNIPLDYNLDLLGGKDMSAVPSCWVEVRLFLLGRSLLQD